MQAAEPAAFLRHGGLPQRWAGQKQWCILEAGYGLGLNFLAAWAMWKTDPERPAMLHFVCMDASPLFAADLLRLAAPCPDMAALAKELAQLWPNAVSGTHRLALQAGCVLLTLCVGEVQALLRSHTFEADTVHLGSLGPQQAMPAAHIPWNLHHLKGVARHCRRGTWLAIDIARTDNNPSRAACPPASDLSIACPAPEILAQCGFVPHSRSVEAYDTKSKPPKIGNLQALLHSVYQPRWQLKPAVGRRLHLTKAAQLQSQVAPLLQPVAMVIGGGLAGAAVAASLARRGWRITVLDSAIAPAAGASGLPAGICAPHMSPDDSWLSRLSRSGIDATLALAQKHLQVGVDFNISGVLERDLTGLPERWHAHAGWIKPAALVHALLDHPNIDWCGGICIAGLERTGGPVDINAANHADRAAQLDDLTNTGCNPHFGQPDQSVQPDQQTKPAEPEPSGQGWCAVDATGRKLATADCVVVAAGFDSLALLEGVTLPLIAIRGMVSWDLHPAARAANMSDLPNFPINGHGSLIPALPLDGAKGWLMGATYERDETRLPPDPAAIANGHAANQQKLRELLGADHSADFFTTAARAWAGVRCATPDRLPVVGPVNTAAAPGLWTCTGMGSRGLTFAVMCGELLAARMHGEPLPIDDRLAWALDAGRFSRV